MDAKQDPMLVTVGMHVEAELIDRSGAVDHLSFDIVPDEQADFAGGFLGAGTPLARAIEGQLAGAQVTYQAGEMLKVRILSVDFAKAQPPEDIAERRREIIQKAVEMSDRTNAMIFASSFSGKWGDYDPQGIEQWDVENPAEGDESKDS